MPATDPRADDRTFMSRALALAERGLFTTTPNPHVGCVIVRDGVVIGEGFHARAGGPHAEVAALADAHARGHDVRGAAVYVNLEPCNHQGRTPPCSRALIDAGIGRVVLAIRDPQGPARGGGAALAAAGIDVTEGVLEDEARELNIGFLSNVTRGIPWVRSKIAASLDGRTALLNGRSPWITSAAARADGHAWRARACAIVTGVGTVVQDNPAMTVRDVATTRQPLRIVIDRHGDTPPDARVLDQGNALIVMAKRKPGVSFGAIETLELPDANGRVDLLALLRVLAQRGINELHVEAGAKLNGALLDGGLIDEWLVYLAPAIIGDPARGMADHASPLTELSARAPLAFHRVDRVGDDLRVIARIVRDSSGAH
jgi:diaminohydroxyphosphoribosylaminopyrimidine deaminase/5-amino-6-(5-phosphoribosylamino)uracil reductase